MQNLHILVSQTDVLVNTGFVGFDQQLFLLQNLLDQTVVLFLDVLQILLVGLKVVGFGDRVGY